MDCVELMTRFSSTSVYKASFNGFLFEGMIQKLELEGRGEDMRFVTSVAKSLFSDGITNWGRIASLVSFGAVLCQALEVMGKGGCVSLVAEEISSYLLSYQWEWLVRNNSWVRTL